jgi:hypothetical protein
MMTERQQNGGIATLLDRHIGARIIWTPQIEALGLAIAEWLEAGLPGGSAYGMQRCGKTRALTYLKSEISDFTGMEVATFFITIAHSLRAVSDATLLKGFLRDAGCMFYAHPDRAILITRLSDFIEQWCEKLNTRRVLILIDEAQNIQFGNYGVPTDLYNLLEVKSLQPFILLVGQPELALTPDSMLEDNHLHVYGRFFKKMMRFSGAATSSFSKILQGFDMVSITPVGEHLAPASSVLFPDQYADGWRFEALAHPMMDALQLILDQHKINEFHIPMQDFVSALRCLLGQLHRKPKLFNKPLSAQAVNAYRDAGLSQTLLAYARVEPKN